MLNKIVDLLPALQAAGAGGLRPRRLSRRARLPRRAGGCLPRRHAEPGERLYRVARARRRGRGEAPHLAHRDRHGGAAGRRADPLGVAVRPVLRRHLLQGRRGHLLRPAPRRREAAGSEGTLPAGYGEPSLGPNSSGLGQVFWYTVESADEKLSAMDLRTLHDWNVRSCCAPRRGWMTSPPGGASRNSTRC
jgi:hypothetical protein